jgi:hypothetical protein
MKKSFLLPLALTTAFAVALPLAAQDAPKPAPASTPTSPPPRSPASRTATRAGATTTGLSQRRPVGPSTSQGLEIGLRFEPTTAGWLDLTYRPGPSASS